MLSTEKKREWAFVLLVGMVGLFLLTKTVRFSLDEGPIRLTIIQNKGALNSIDTPRDVLSKKMFMLRELDFPQTRMLQNTQYGKLGYTQNFFLDAEVDMQVKRAGDYRFTVRSDDGFRLLIDAKNICQHPGDRPMLSTECSVTLAAGDHRLSLSYFQGGGPMGLQVSYQMAGENTSRFVGVDSDNLVFKKSQ